MHIFEVGVLQSLFRRDSLRRFKLHHLVEEINACLVHVNAHFLQTLEGTVNLPLGEARFEIGQVANALPCFLGRSAHDLENFENLSNL